MTPEEIAAEAARVAAEAAQNQKTPEQVAAEQEAARRTNADNAQRRLLETAQARVTELEAAEQARADAALSEADRLKKEAADAKKLADDSRLEMLRLKAGKALPEAALQFLTGTDEAALAAQAEELAKVYKPAPTAAGTVTNPGGGQEPSLDERIAAAEKAGQRGLSIQLKREKAFGN